MSKQRHRRRDRPWDRKHRRRPAPSPESPESRRFRSHLYAEHMAEAIGAFFPPPHCGLSHDDRVRQQWVITLRVMLGRHRLIHPNDRRSDDDIMKSLMDGLVECGAIEKRDGRYTIGELI